MSQLAAELGLRLGRDVYWRELCTAAPPPNDVTAQDGRSRIWKRC